MNQSESVHRIHICRPAPQLLAVTSDGYPSRRPAGSLLRNGQTTHGLKAVTAAQVIEETTLYAVFLLRSALAFAALRSVAK
ncbi:hypothetical protein [Rubripirellula reticaptiva]|uniref:Uncharacterized protein n=1 Tax=Rubripirellula reticaptiva TaxID=2528013 RepID=A0A5C6EIW5_9BACT|nr:hypothetical protein [Rubripirellula reticaptiva]TWU48395.1 hypothetical protein Poly59_52430 [Rubripirellula reticaptiva]